MLNSRRLFEETAKQKQLASGRPLSRQQPPPEDDVIDIPIESVTAATAEAVSALLTLVSQPSDAKQRSRTSPPTAAEFNHSCSASVARFCTLTQPEAIQARRLRRGRRYAGKRVNYMAQDAGGDYDSGDFKNDDNANDIHHEDFDDDISYDDGDDDVTYDDDGGEIFYDDGDGTNGGNPDHEDWRVDEATACLLSHYTDLDSRCQESISATFSGFGDTMITPACDTEAKNYCGTNLAASLIDFDDDTFNASSNLPYMALDCLKLHYDQLGDTCKARVDKRMNREGLIPSSFLEARHFRLTQVAIFGALTLLLAALLFSAFAFYKALRIKHLIQVKGPSTYAAWDKRINEDDSTTLGWTASIRSSSRLSSCFSRCSCCYSCFSVCYKALRGFFDLVLVLFDPVGTGGGIGEKMTNGTSTASMDYLHSISFLRVSYWAQVPTVLAMQNSVQDLVQSEGEISGPCVGKPTCRFSSCCSRPWRPAESSSEDGKLLFNVSGSVRRGEMVALMGPSGSGKTTLLRLLGGHTRSGAIAGKRRINGLDVAAEAYEGVLRKHGGFVDQSDVTMLGEWNLTVWETISYASLLRLPAGMSVTARLARAAEVLKSLDLVQCAHTNVSGKQGATRSSNGQNEEVGETMHTGQGQISGGQLKRLSVALELLRSPAALFLDEPTSGLDSASSLVLVSRLSALSKGCKEGEGMLGGSPMVIATIHQPRADVLALFDHLLLLKEGRLVYAGHPSDCATHFASISQVAINPGVYQNPADFVLDALDPRNLCPFPSLTSDNHPGGTIQMTSLAVCLDEETLADLNNGDVEDKVAEEYQDESSEDDESKPMLSTVPANNSTSSFFTGSILIKRWLGSHRDRDIDREEKSNQLSAAEGLLRAFEGCGHLFELHQSRLQRDREALHSDQLCDDFGNEVHVSDSDFSPSFDPRVPAESSVSLLLSEQTILLFARRTHRQTVDWRGIVLSHLQIISISTTVSFAFSYDVEETNQAVGVPYQTYMTLLLVSSYAFMTSYFLLPSEYLDERPLIEAERLRGHLSFKAYLAAATLGELPRGFWHVILTLGPAYVVHGLNPSTTSRVFAFVCLGVGVAAWQGIICLCAAVTTHVTAATLLAFLFFGGGTLFGGLLIEYENIPLIFRPAYHFSVTAVTQRALVVNDFICCYITLPCGGAGESASGLFSNSGVHFSAESLTAAADVLGVGHHGDEPICPAGVDVHRGNLGRKALELLGLDDIDNYASLSTLFAVAVASRTLAWIFLKQRERLNHRLYSHDPE